MQPNHANAPTIPALPTNSVKPIVIVDAAGKPWQRFRSRRCCNFLQLSQRPCKRTFTIVLTQQNMPEFNMHTLPLVVHVWLHTILLSKDCTWCSTRKMYKIPSPEYVSNLGFETIAHSRNWEVRACYLFFSGGRESEFEGEERILVPSPKVATYDLQPEMALNTARQTCRCIEHSEIRLHCVEFCQWGHGGHTGVREAIVKSSSNSGRMYGQSGGCCQSHRHEVIIIPTTEMLTTLKILTGSPNTALSLLTSFRLYLPKTKTRK